MKIWRRKKIIPIVPIKEDVINLPQYIFPKQPNIITSSWTMGHTCFMYHNLDWVYLNEFHTQNPIMLIMN